MNASGLRVVACCVFTVLLDGDTLAQQPAITEPTDWTVVTVRATQQGR